MRLLRLVLACTALLVTGCGGDSEEDKVKQAFEDYIQAIEDKDGDKFCESVMSPELAAKSKDERGKDVDECKDRLSAEVFEGAPELGDADVDKVTVNGDRATADVSTTENGQKESSEVKFLKVDGDWKLRFDSK